MNSLELNLYVKIWPRARQTEVYRAPLRQARLTASRTFDYFENLFYTYTIVTRSLSPTLRHEALEETHYYLKWSCTLMKSTTSLRSFS